MPCFPRCRLIWWGVETGSYQLKRTRFYWLPLSKSSSPPLAGRLLCSASLEGDKMPQSKSDCRLTPRPNRRYDYYSNRGDECELRAEDQKKHADTEANLRRGTA